MERRQHIFYIYQVPGTREHVTKKKNVPGIRHDVNTNGTVRRHQKWYGTKPTKLVRYNVKTSGIHTRYDVDTNGIRSIRYDVNTNGMYSIHDVNTNGTVWSQRNWVIRYHVNTVGITNKALRYRRPLRSLKDDKYNQSAKQTGCSA